MDFCIALNVVAEWVGIPFMLSLATTIAIEKAIPEKPSLGAEPFIEVLISTRNQLREAKQWQLADEIRTKLGELGIALEDTVKGTVWKRKR